ncbi:MAG TPA: RMD1 family protein [Holophaga sp.]|nr:RMD1 family protein [Holophaga sp.]
MKPPEPEELVLQADYFEGQIDTRAFRTKHPHYPVIAFNPLVLEPEMGSWIYVERFGAVVFWNCSETLIQTFLADLQALDNTGPRVVSTHDSLSVLVGSDEETVGFSTVWLKELTLGKLKIISLALAQSVALDYFETSVSSAMARFQPVVRTMREKGHLRQKPGEILSLVAFAMEVRAIVLENLTLFDDPPESWESESLAHLDSELFDQFDLEERINAINQKLGYLKDAGSTLMEVLTNRKSVRLEWIVIILIFVETAFFVWKEMLPR